MSDRDFELSDRPDAQEVRWLEKQLYAFNAAATGCDDGRDLAIWWREPGGAVRAGLIGHTWSGTCEVRVLWVREEDRHTGVGSRLLRAAEAEARARGCQQLVLTTHSFQAPDFYRRHGYQAVGEWRDYPRGHSEIFLRKTL